MSDLIFVTNRIGSCLPSSFYFTQAHPYTTYAHTQNPLTKLMASWMYRWSSLNSNACSHRKRAPTAQQTILCLISVEVYVKPNRRRSDDRRFMRLSEKKIDCNEKLANKKNFPLTNYVTEDKISAGEFFTQFMKSAIVFVQDELTYIIITNTLVIKKAQQNSHSKLPKIDFLYNDCFSFFALLNHDFRPNFFDLAFLDQRVYYAHVICFFFAFVFQQRIESLMVFQTFLKLLLLNKCFMLLLSQLLLLKLFLSLLLFTISRIQSHLLFLLFRDVLCWLLFFFLVLLLNYFCSLGLLNILSVYSLFYLFQLALLLFSFQLLFSFLFYEHLLGYIGSRLFFQNHLLNCLILNLLFLFLFCILRLFNIFLFQLWLIFIQRRPFLTLLFLFCLLALLLFFSLIKLLTYLSASKCIFRVEQLQFFDVAFLFVIVDSLFFRVLDILRILLLLVVKDREFVLLNIF